jgi:hypothetical protein
MVFEDKVIGTRFPPQMEEVPAEEITGTAGFE